MIISNEELKKYIFGAAQFCEENGYLQMHRFTEKQRAYVYEKNPVLYSRMISAASVTIEFYTDSNTLSFVGKMHSLSAEKRYTVEIYEDGIMRSVFEDREKDGEETVFSATLKNGRKHVVIYLPYFSCMQIKDFRLDDNSVTEPCKRGKKVIFFGDSITQGFYAKLSSLTYVNIIARKLNLNVLNQSISGDVFDSGNLDEDLSFDAEEIIVSYGTNDWNKGCDLKKTAEEYFEKLVKIYPRQKIYVIPPLWRGDADRVEGGQIMSFYEARNVIKAAAEKYENVKVLESIDFIPHYAGFFKDGYLHPNDLGFVFYAENLMRELK